MRLAWLVSSACILSTVTVSVSPALGQSQPPSAPVESTYIYYHDELANGPLPPALARLRRADSIFAPCEAAGGETAAVIVPLVLGLFKIFGNIFDASVRDRERRRIEAMSRSSAGLRTDASFPLRQRPSGNTFRCLVVDRVATVNDAIESRAVYVMGMRQVGTSTAFTLEPLAARIDSSPLFRRDADRVNATVSVTFQSVVTSGGLNSVATLPAFSASFPNLALRQIGRPRAGGQHVSPVLPILPATAPTSVATAVTEADTRLASQQQLTALEQANRTLLLSALGDILKAAITD